MSGTTEQPTAGGVIGAFETATRAIALVSAQYGQGLVNMRSRVASVDATIEMASDSPGTRIVVHRVAGP